MADSKKQVRPGGPHGRGHGYQRPQDLRAPWASSWATSAATRAR